MMGFINVKRRDAFKSMIALAAAPAILKVEMIMPVKPIVTGGLNYDRIAQLTLDQFVPHLAENIYNSSQLLRMLQDNYNYVKSNMLHTNGGV